jgi:translation initiation factor 2B subunit (eIF-2B alpha/beta/delta family)
MQQFHEQISKIIHDHISGSGTILLMTIQAVRNYLIDDDEADQKILVQELNRLLTGQGGFAVLYHFINQVFLEIEKQTGNTNLLEFVDNYSKSWEDAQKQVVSEFVKQIPGHKPGILLHSSSTTLQGLFEKMALTGVQATIYQTLSGPLNEGKIQAKFLAALGFRVNMIHESATANFMEDIDMAVFGADVFIADVFINKAGTFPLSLLLRHFNKPVYVLCDSRKIMNAWNLPSLIRSQLLKEEERSEAEIWQDHPGGIFPRNYYFEKIPLKLASRIFTEKGAFMPAEIGRMAETIKVSGLFSGAETTDK